MCGKKFIGCAQQPMFWLVSREDLLHQRIDSGKSTGKLTKQKQNEAGVTEKEIISSTYKSRNKLMQEQ